MTTIAWPLVALLLGGAFLSGLYRLVARLVGVVEVRQAKQHVAIAALRADMDAALLKVKNELERLDRQTQDRGM